ncbi:MULTISPECIES: alpha/beta fold hydrolase [unclassified Nocardioides]|uniref:alpha/beta fold hydrolase n=1 Tax=unclassified Nocardioides TaxID=2615069 RepID=UPI00361E4D29
MKPGVAYDVHGSGSPTILLLPTWTIIHRRFWKLQVPYLARHFRVVTYDGPGNGDSPRPLDPEAYAHDAQVAHALSVLDATDTDRAVVVGLSRAANWALDLAANHADRVLGTALVGPSADLATSTVRHPRWDDFGPAIWRTRYPDFLAWFFDLCLPEPHSTKPIEDTVGWGLETTPDVLEAEEATPWPSRDEVVEWCGRISSPVLLLHGDRDRVSPIARSETIAELTGGHLVRMEGSGHLPLARDPVRVNLLLRDFVVQCAGARPATSVG